MKLKFLIFIPILTYLISYAYLSYYHQQFWILNTVIHEGGVYTLFETMFYASHFLGHIPVHIVLALWFVGCYLCLTNPNALQSKNLEIKNLVYFLIIFLLLSLFFSFIVFGFEDTLAFISQQKQGVNIYKHGGSWDLHLPSTLLLFILIPIVIYLTKFLFHREIELSLRGISYIVLALTIMFCITFWLHRNIFLRLFEIWVDPRYLAHSVRELATFPIIYFPLALYIFLRSESQSTSKITDNHWVFFIILSVIFLILFFYQVSVSLMTGIGDLSQKPSFAHNGKLNIFYLLSSHYFEHFLDAIFFTLFALILLRSNVRRSRVKEK